MVLVEVDKSGPSPGDSGDLIYGVRLAEKLGAEANGLVPGDSQPPLAKVIRGGPLAKFLGGDDPQESQNFFVVGSPKSVAELFYKSRHDEASPGWTPWASSLRR